MLRVALKYCGGCNPGYDRVSLAEAIRGRLAGRVQFVQASAGEEPDVILVLAGCETACADPGAVGHWETVVIRSAEDADAGVADLERRMAGGGQDKGRPASP